MDMDLKSSGLKIGIVALAAAMLLSSATVSSAQTNRNDQGSVGQGHIEFERPRIALALGGDGLRSAACLGVLKVLDEEGIPVDIIAGTGMGAVVGGLYSAGVSTDHIEREFTDGDLMNSYITVPVSLRLLIAPLLYAPRLIGFKPYDGLYRGQKFAHYLNHQVPEAERNIEDLKISFGAVAVNLLDGKSKVLTQGNLGKALQASAAIPALRKPVKLDDGGLYVDGAVLNNVPVKEARSMGGDLVIAINVDEEIKPALDADFHSVGSVGHRVVSLHMQKFDQIELKSADYVIKPELEGIGLISKNAEDARKAIAAGERAARKAIPEIRDIINAAAATSSRNSN